MDSIRFSHHICWAIIGDGTGSMEIFTVDYAGVADSDLRSKRGQGHWSCDLMESPGGILIDHG